MTLAPEQNGITDDWWRRACDDSQIAIAFVGIDDKFIYVNLAWNKLTGYAASQLVGLKRWQDITVPDHIGADQVSTEAVSADESEGYYIEKEYLRPDGSKVPVGIMVMRHPPFGPHEGYIVFAQQVGSPEYLLLKQSYGELVHTVAQLEQTQQGFARHDERIDALGQQISNLTTTVNTLVGRNQGVTVSGDTIGRDKNSQTTLIVLGVAVVALVAFALGGRLSWDGTRVDINGAPQAVEIDP